MQHLSFYIPSILDIPGGCCTSFLNVPCTENNQKRKTAMHGTYMAEKGERRVVMKSFTDFSTNTDLSYRISQENQT